MARITGVIPNYNGERFVLDAIESMVNQTVRPNKIVVIDDGSTDRSWLQISSYLGKDKNDSYIDNGLVCAYHMQHGGVSNARNFAIKKYSKETDIYALLDSDDLYMPNKIEQSVKFFGQNSIALVYSDFITLDMNTGIKIREMKKPFSYLELLRDNIVNTNSLIAKNIFGLVGLFKNYPVCEDYDMWLKIAHVADMIHIPEPLFIYRRYGSSITDKLHPSVSSVYNQCITPVMQQAWERYNG